MKEVFEDDRMMRQFLLGQLDLIDRERIEEQFMLDATFRERLLMAEESLIEEYLDDSMNESERHQFNSVFLSSAQQREKLTLARAITARARAEVASASVAAAVPPEILTAARAQSVSSNWRVLWIAAALVIVLLAAIWLIQRGRGNENELTNAIQVELTELNSGSRSGSLTAEETLSIVLAPVNTRGSGAPTVSRSTASIVEFSLLPAIVENVKYNALIEKDGVSKQFEVSNLPLADKPEGRAVRLRIPMRLLEHGTYRIELRFVGANADSTFAGEYRFQVVD